MPGRRARDARDLGPPSGRFAVLSSRGGYNPARRLECEGRSMRLVPEGLHKRYETILRDFEWNWTKAALAALILWFIAIIAVGVIPSWWLYFAQRPPLNWTQDKFWLFKLRDFVAVI